MDTATYWEERYRAGQTSGLGSYGDFADFKAEVINSFLLEKKIETVLDLGCGDGHQASLLRVPHYTGFDISPESIRICRDLFKDKENMEFFDYFELHKLKTYDLTLSLDVIFHLLEDDTFTNYMKALFSHASKYVVIYSSNKEVPQTGHVRQHCFSNWKRMGAKQWKLIRKINNRYPFDPKKGTGSMSKFYIYEKEE
jgi:SAM-dependent methyltransferase